MLLVKKRIKNFIEATGLKYDYDYAFEECNDIIKIYNAIT